jgi:hypothetical protein
VEARQVRGEVVPFPLRPRAQAPLPVLDVRFRALIGEAGWASLPETVQARFGKRLDGGRTATYAGEVVECRMSRLGWLLAQIGRLIGAPLPLSRAAFVPASVCVTEDPASGGQYWTRIYGRRRGFPQVIHSSKRFAGPTGLEEYVGRGFGIALRIVAENGALHFYSDHYFVQLRRLRLRLPRWLEPGALRISHVDCNHGLFAFVLSVRHPRAGELVRQTAMFRERIDPEEGK